ncbi:polysaccharide pyruvyl transferase CsaB [Paenibacillus woosongensis]|uniref:Polysaccharide pyruvyl transferase CsaB n=1 Tax=Paenibacillus woosongensis TaxID=307580 RepID=A0ABQ4MW80_9BACL|nr:polysaccharide pyruvyl transferase CsaB [Paenibacillus woosongensis]GIP60177.1 polysaccharide pyruvyl transferase CsaB [Paenibacillus woosongensis]
MVATSSQTIVISGYYGFRNIGDEAVLQSILTALREESEAAGLRIEPVVLSIDPEWTARTYGVKAVHRMKFSEVRDAIKNSSGLISGGGSLLQDATGIKTIPYYLGVVKLAQWLRKPTFVYAQGIGPVNRRMFRPLIASVYRRCEYVSVRDVESSALLRDIGIPKNMIEVVPDPVMGLSLPRAVSRGDITASDSGRAAGSEEGGAASGKRGLPVVGVSVRFWNPQRTELMKLAEGLDALLSRMALHIRFLPFHYPGDDEASRFVMNMLSHAEDHGSEISIAPQSETPLEMLEEVSRCDLLIGMRLHSLIYAASQNVPMLGISYDPKIDHFLGRLGSVPVGSSADLDHRIVAAQSERLLSDREGWLASHAAQLEVLRREAQLPAKRIVEYLRK